MSTAVVNSAVVNHKPSNLLDRHALVLTQLASGPRTMDEFVNLLGLYINTWAPVATLLLKAGHVRRTGERRETQHGGTAAVLEVTDLGMEQIGGCNTRRMVATTPMRCFQPRCDGTHHYMRRDHLA